MEHIIQQITEEFVKKFCEHFAERGLYDLGAMTADSRDMSFEFIKELLNAVIGAADRALVAEKNERKKDGILIHERDVPRTQFTSLGPFTYRRTYFDTPHGRDYLLDRILDVNAYERVDTTVSAALVNHAGEYSFGRSTDIVTGGQVSRQTAWKKAMGIGETYLIPERVKETPEVLHIFADEDHVHLQNGKSAILPLVTVCGGKKAVCEGRNELVDPVHIGGYGLKPEEHWSYVYAVCAAKYDMGKVRKVIIYSDAAKWIKESRWFFPNPVYVLDDYHYRKHLKTLLAGDICSRYTLPVYSAIRQNRKNSFQVLMEEIEEAVLTGMPECREREKKLERVREEGAFLLAHWDAVQKREDPDSIGSCSEALVSHVYSERFSRNPMGWSKAGLEKMTMIRVFIKNGGRVIPLDIGLDKRTHEERSASRGRIEKYAALVRRQEAELLGEVKNWKWFGREDVMMSQARSGTRHALRLLGKTQNISY